MIKFKNSWVCAGHKTLVKRSIVVRWYMIVYSNKVHDVPQRMNTPEAVLLTASPMNFRIPHHLVQCVRISTMNQSLPPLWSCYHACSIRNISRLEKKEKLTG